MLRDSTLHHLERQNVSPNTWKLHVVRAFPDISLTCHMTWVGGGDYRSFSRSKHKKPPKFFHPMRFLNLQFMGRPDKEHNFRNYLYLATGSQVLIQPSHTGNKNRTPNTLSFCVYYISDYHSCRSIHRPGCLHLMEPSASTSQPPPPAPSPGESSNRPVGGWYLGCRTVHQADDLVEGVLQEVRGALGHFRREHTSFLPARMGIFTSMSY